MAKVKLSDYFIAARINEDQWEKLNSYCKAKGVTTSEWIRECINRLP
jgi:hypothetical protein